MPTFRSHTSTLTRGSLIMSHSSTTWVRYVRMERMIDAESIGVLCIGGILGFTGWLSREMVAVYAATAIFVGGVIAWSIRRMRLYWRRCATPRMAFISDEGINAILPNSAGTFLPWEGTSAHEFFHVRGGLPDNIYVADLAMRGMMLEGASGDRLFFTNDLDGYEDLLSILLELGIPINVVNSSSSLGTSYGSFTYWLNHLEHPTWEEEEESEI